MGCSDLFFGPHVIEAASGGLGRYGHRDQG